MIPADVASRLRLVTQDLPAPPQPVAPSQQLTDILSEFGVGQRIMAEIQALLPNGTYRAVVGQRDVTLALPFSAKPGDSLELEVTESDGKLGLAFVADRSKSETPSKTADSATTTLSSAGKLIGDLVSGVDQQGKRPGPAALNANQPLVSEFPKVAADLVPVLKDSLTKSGMFYESHQARWVEGRLPTTSLLQEPQGRLSPNAAALLAAPPPPPPGTGIPEQYSQAHSTPGTPQPATTPTSDAVSVQDEPLHPHEVNATHASAPSAPSNPSSGTANTETQGTSSTTSNPPSPASQTPQSAPGSPIHPELTPLVQQQLDALATQTYVWQGQVWPGQKMDWEIVEQDSRHQAAEGDFPYNWQTRLKLDLPTLGGIEATLKLGKGGVLEVSLLTANAATQGTLSAAAGQLRSQLDSAGLSLAGFAVHHAQTER